MNTLMGVLSRERGKERKKILTLLIPVILILIAPLAYFAYTAWIRENKTIIQSDSIDWKSLYSKVGESVYLVLIKTTKGPQTTYRRCGTAWSVAPGKLATNAHVANIWNEKEPGDEMIVRRYGRIVNISSLAGLVRKPHMIHYATSKAAVIAFTRSCSEAFAPYNIRVNCVAPGCIDTDMARQADPALVSQIVAGTPLGRIGTVDDVAAVVRFLLSDESDFITGQTLPVCGGRV